MVYFIDYFLIGNWCASKFNWVSEVVHCCMCICTLCLKFDLPVNGWTSCQLACITCSFKRFFLNLLISYSSSCDHSTLFLKVVGSALFLKVVESWTGEGYYIQHEQHVK